MFLKYLIFKMPSATYPEPPPIPKWTRPGKTTDKLEWADIKVIDISSFDEPGGKQKLAEELRDAVTWPLTISRALINRNCRSIILASSA